jgi:3-hydroxyacyl-CoA dehydrogenase
MGGGLELALGCHFRVARPDAPIALPEVKLGILPGAGGTQRLPRVVGVERALGMIVSGASVSAAELRDTRLFDAIVDGDFMEGALAFARRVVAEKRPGTRVRDIAIDCPGAEKLFRSAREKAAVEARNQPAPQRCIDAVAAAVAMPFDEGLAFERRTFLELVESPESRALRHAFFAERAAARIPDVPETTPVRKIATLGVVGAGTMGTGIAMNGLNAGVPVALLEMNREALDRGVAMIRKNYEASVGRGKLAPEALERNMALLRPTLAYDDLASADLVIEAVFEEMELKCQVFAKLDRVAKPGAILATNTSTLDVDRIAAATGRPQDVLGMHFFSPANVMKLLEVVRGKETADDVLMTVMRLAKQMGKTAVVSGVCDGFIGNRMVEQYLRQAMFLLEEGASPQQVDAALEAFGMAMGPFRMSDLAGNDVGWRIRKRRYVEKPDVVYSRIADRLCEEGRFGQKTGKGWYAYETGRRAAIPDPAVETLIARHRTELGIVPRTIDDAEIVGRCVLSWSTRALGCWRRALRCARRTSTSSISPATVFPGIAAARCSMPTFPAFPGSPPECGSSRACRVLTRRSGSRHLCWPDWPQRARPSTDELDRGVGACVCREGTALRASYPRRPQSCALAPPCSRLCGRLRSDREDDIDRRPRNPRAAGRKRAVGAEDLCRKVSDQTCQIGKPDTLSHEKRHIGMAETLRRHFDRIFDSRVVSAA